MDCRRLALAIGLVLLSPGCTCGGARSDAGNDTAVATDATGPGDAASPTDSATTTDAGASTSDGGGGAVTYRAVAVVGALDRVFVLKADPVADSCVRVRLVTPPVGGALAVATPAGWSIEYADATSGAAACDVFSPGTTTTATSGAGTITFGPTSPGGIYPCTVDLNATLDFPPPWPTPVEALIATAVPVEGTGC